MRSIFLSIVITLAISIKFASTSCEIASKTTVSGTFAPKSKICPGDLIFEDDFYEFNLQKWQHENTLAGGGNWEFQWYLNNRSNSYVDDGILKIKPTLLADDTGNKFLYSGTLDLTGDPKIDGCSNGQNYGCVRTGSATHILNPIKSARIRTLDSFAFKYGRIEVRAKLPAGDWLWPAIWLLPRWNQYSGWPASGEINLMESRGNKDLINSNGVNIGTQQVGCTLHWGPDQSYDKFLLTHFQKRNAAGFDANFHSYQIYWTPDMIIFSIDDQVVGRVSPPEGGFWAMGELDKTGLNNPWKGASKMAPFDQEFFLVINLAVGGVGGYFPDEAQNPKKKPWKNTSKKALTDFWAGRDNWLPTWDFSGDSSTFQVDYVRIWAV